MALPWEDNATAVPWEWNGLYSRTVTITRPIPNVQTSGVAVGLQGYSGLTESVGPTGLGGETTIASGLYCSIQARAMGKATGDDKLPSDSPGPPVWYIFIPESQIAKGFVRDRDVVTDDEGYRYQVASAYWNTLGYRLNCIRLEA